MCCKCTMSCPGTKDCCQSCGRILCRKCARDYGYHVVESEEMNRITSCKYCSVVSASNEGRRKSSEKVHPLTSPRHSPDPPSPCFSSEIESVQNDHLALYLEVRDNGFSPHALTSSSVTSFSAYPSPISVCQSPSRCDEEETENSGKHFFSLSNDFYRDISETDSSVSARHELYSFKSAASSPSDSPSGISCTSSRVRHSVQQEQEAMSISCNNCAFHRETMAILGNSETGVEDPYSTDDCSDDLSDFHGQRKKSQQPLDFENNGLMWYPPPPDDEADDNYFEYDDEDDEIGDSGAMFSCRGSISSMFPAKEKLNEGNREPLRAVIEGHFRALVSELLQAEDMREESDAIVWLDIVSKIAWQAANFVKPDTSRGGSMDPGDYVKIKCTASGSPNDSTVIRGIVCTKNIKHKRMTSQYRHPRLLLLGGALEYQRSPNQLASFNYLLQQENDHLKMIVSKIEALRPNVLLVERSVSSYAQEYLLAKDISLVLNVKRSLMERIALCTGALITPSIDHLSRTQVGHCELFRIERVSEEHEPANQHKRKPSKTLMYFEGCPRRLGCTVLLRGMSRKELKKVKHVVQYAIFAAYHLSLETSFLADEGASLPEMTMKPYTVIPEVADNSVSLIPDSVLPNSCLTGVVAHASVQNEKSASFLEHGSSSSEQRDAGHDSTSPGCLDSQIGTAISDGCGYSSFCNMGSESPSLNPSNTELSSDTQRLPKPQILEIMTQEEAQCTDNGDMTKSERVVDNDTCNEYFSATDSHQSILVSFSSRCVLKGTVCERSRLLRIKFYGHFDKPLGRYLRDDLFGEVSCCQSCNELAEAHVQCYTHQQGNLTINVKRLSSPKLPGERDGKIWMWHRCLRCSHIDGVPPATRRVIMSDAAWGLSFGKFLELSFSNHATANRVAPCGHSLQKDCLRYYGFGSMVAFFRYCPIDILSVQLPPSVLEFSSQVKLEWTRKEVEKLSAKMETFYLEISGVLDNIEHESKSFRHEVSDLTELHNHVMELKNMLERERNYYRGMLHPADVESSQLYQKDVDILELNHLRRSLIIGSHVWNRQLYSLDFLVKTDYCFTEVSSNDGKHDHAPEENVSEPSKLHKSSANDLQSEQEFNLPTAYHRNGENRYGEGDVTSYNTHTERIHCLASNLSERIDSAWTGTHQLLVKPQPFHGSCSDRSSSVSVRRIVERDNFPNRRVMSPVRVQSFDSALRFQENMQKGLSPSSLRLSKPRSFDTFGDYKSMERDPISTVFRSYSQVLPSEAQKLNLILNSEPSFISSASHIAEGARLLLPQAGQNNVVIAVYDNEPTSIISYALSTKEYKDWVADKLDEQGGWSANENLKEDSHVSNFLPWQSFCSLDLDCVNYESHGSENASASMSNHFRDPKQSPHIRITFVDESSTTGGKVKFSVTSYFAKEFDKLRKKCCRSEMNFICSLSRCKSWSAQGGKSNVYFAKSLDERFIVKQVTKTELESFEDFATAYFKYLTDSLSSGSPTCLAKVLGFYQVSVKHLKGGKETKMDLMVMENLFFQKHISRIYDLKGSVRSRYNPDTRKNSVLLDMNLVETLRTEPIFLGSKAKKTLERAVWNDTSFLASVDVMDYSLLVGVDEESKELVLGIIDFMRQYTWDKHLETWVKASGILGGPKNASPTIISPKQYKKRFRKAMTTYFLTVPDQWSS